MKTYLTEIRAIDPNDGEFKTWCGPELVCISLKEAEHKLQNEGLGYCKIIGELVAEIPCKKGTYKPDWDTMIDYEDQSLN